jgi:hypothetical protein
MCDASATFVPRSAQTLPLLRAGDDPELVFHEPAAPRLRCAGAARPVSFVVNTSDPELRWVGASCRCQHAFRESVSDWRVD